MKRNVALVSYDTSEDEEETEIQPVKKKKLPSLSPSLVVPVPKDNPALHQGRIRTTPHVDGQWACHVYVSLTVKKRSGLSKLIAQVLRSAKELAPSLRDFWGADSDEHGEDIQQDLDLHVSLSRPIFLRMHQRDDLKAAVKMLAQKQSPFKVSFSTFSVLTNDERTRTFLALDVGAGHYELKSLALGLTPTLKAFRQKEYYDDPRFHASIAWALLKGPVHRFGGEAPILEDADDDLLSGLTNANGAQKTVSCNFSADEPSGTHEPPVRPEAQFHAIDRLPDTLIPLLNDQYATALSSKESGSFDVREIIVKIGKKVFSWNLQG